MDNTKIDLTVYADSPGHFCSLAYELTHRRCRCIYQLGSKIKRAGQFMQFVQVSALFSLQPVTKKITATDYYKITGWQNVNELIHSL